ncbi:MAG: hypothetical protein COB02_04600 [Candidatus Cloacimonadota bacterium]|nr:MAG: hypothetical protein COB02_04600 [Candidatus Cloacimonadota bacterium]
MLKLIKKVLPIFGLVLFIRLLSNISSSAFVDSLLSISFYKVILIIFCSWFGLVAKGFRWTLIASNTNINKKDLLRLYYGAMFLGIITPGRIGEITKVQFLKDRGVEYSLAFYLTIYDRVFDVGYLLITSLFFLAYVYHFSKFLIVSIIVFMILFLFVQYFIAIKLIPQKKIFIKMLFSYLLTIMSYLVFGFGFSMLLNMSNINQIVLTTLSVTLGNLVALVPVSIMGLGTREYVFINVLPFLSEILIISSSLVHLTLSVLASLLFCSLFYKKDFLKIKKNKLQPKTK